MRLIEYGLEGISDYSALVCVRVSDAVQVTGFIKVIDANFGSRALYKFAGGHWEADDLAQADPPLATAMRELKGEAGLELPAGNFRYIGKWLGRRGDHWKMLFLAECTESDVPWMHNHDKGNEGEKPEFLPLERFRQLAEDGKVMAEHYGKMLEFDLFAPHAPALP